MYQTVSHLVHDTSSAGLKRLLITDARISNGKEKLL